MSKPAQTITVPKITRNKAERMLSAGKDPSLFMDHPNYHVRKKAWTKLGKPAMDAKFLQGIHA